MTVVEVPGILTVATLSAGVKTVVVRGIVNVTVTSKLVCSPPLLAETPTKIASLVVVSGDGYCSLLSGDSDIRLGTWNGNSDRRTVNIHFFLVGLD